VKADFKNISYADNRIDIVTCFQLPATDDWMPYTSTISVNGQVTDFDTVGWADQGSKYNSSPLASSYRCYSLGYPVKSRPGDQITVTIADLRIDPVFQLEKYCAQAQQQLAATYPDLKFTCNSPSGGAYFNLVQAPASMSAEHARRLINDAIEEAIYGPWTFTLTR
ncbi:MAG: hypothetical protein KJ058_19720, partial [Thermoanaerobaculia bacterium]|nr:hypothetical protein [Thermoanaerobaculia bacterium]